MPRPAAWTIADLIDFEYLLSEQAGIDSASEAPVRQALAADPTLDRRTFFHLWLAEQRKRTTTLPGRQFTAGWHTLLTLGAFAGLLLGFGVAGAHLTYHSAEPINLPKFLLWTIGLQWLVLLLAGAFWLLRRSLPDLRDFYPLQAVLWGLDTLLRRLPGQQRDHLRAALASLRHKREIYGSLAVWPLVIVTQVFAVTFNLGVLCTTLLLVQVQDLRFGWQTTPQVTTASAPHLVAAVSAPWSWAPFARPTDEQITATQFAPGQPLSEIQTAAARAWWPFVIYSVLCYGLTVRAALLIYGALQLRRQLRAVAFDHAEANALRRRLLGPVIRPDAAGPQLEIPRDPAGTPHAAPAGPTLALVASDAEVSEPELAQYLAARFRWQLGAMRAAEIDRPGGNAELIAELERQPEAWASIVIVSRARRSPIRAIALFLQRLTAAASRQTEVIVLLIGRRTGSTFAPVDDEDFTHWKNFNAIHGLHLGLEKWTP